MDGFRDMRRRVDRVEDDAPRRLPGPEREARRSRQVLALAGLSLEGENECAHALVDKAVQMMEDDCLKYIQLDECVTRGQELGATDKKDKTLRTDSRGFVREATTESSLLADTSTDYKVRSAFLRRGLAFDQAQIMSFATHEKMVNCYFQELMRDAPHGFRKVSMDQVVRADREVFRKLAELTRTGLKPTMAGTRPVDDCLIAVLESASVQILLLPLGGSQNAGEKRAAPPGIVAPPGQG